MKLILVFLIALSSMTFIDSSPIDHLVDTNTILDKMREYIDLLSKSIRGLISQVKSSGESLIKSVLENSEKVADQAEETVENFMTITLKRIKNIAERSQIASDCVDSNRSSIKTVIQETHQNLKKCLDTAADQRQHIQDEIETQINAILDHSDALSDIINECLETTGTPMKLFTCVTKKGIEISENTFKLIANAAKAVQISGHRLFEILTETRTCAAKSTDEAQHKIKDILDDIQDCISAHGNIIRKNIL